MTSVVFTYWKQLLHLTALLIVHYVSIFPQKINFEISLWINKLSSYHLSEVENKTPSVCTVYVSDSTERKDT